MKRTLRVVLLALGTIPLFIQADDSQLGSCDCKATSHSFLWVRPQYQKASPERLVGFRNWTEAREDGWGGAIQLVPFGGRSSRGSKLATYFTPFCKDTLTVRENPTLGDNTDIIAQNFNIATKNGINGIVGTGFQSTIQFRPRQTVFGLGFTYKQDINYWFNWDCERSWWFEISTPLEHVKNTMHLTENIINDGGGALTVTGLTAPQVIVGNMVAAFAQSAWNFGKIDNSEHSGSRSKTRLADIEFSVGYDWLMHENCMLQSYVGVVIPTGNKPKGEFVFEPIVGANKHFGVMIGGSAQFCIWENDCWHAYVYIDSDSRYVFNRTETRSFDVKFKPWSRYQAVYANQAQATQAAALAAGGNAQAAILLASPGINFFTKDVRVSPRLASTSNLGLGLSNDCYDLEIGYNFYARQAECVKLKDPWVETVAFKDAGGAGTTQPLRTINNNADFSFPLAPPANAIPAVPLAQYSFSVIKATDLDLESAATPAIISNTIYGAATYKWNYKEYPLFVNLGGSYEFARDNNVLNRFLFWGKFGVAF